MDKLSLINKLREMTVERGATEAEEVVAAEKIGKLLMASPDLIVSSAESPVKLTQAPMTDAMKAAYAQQDAAMRAQQAYRRPGMQQMGQDQAAQFFRDFLGGGFR